jgi:hypothetical protein
MSDLIITKRGSVPVAKRVPIPPQTPLFGALAGNVREEGDIVSPLENVWEACHGALYARSFSSITAAP